MRFLSMYRYSAASNLMQENLPRFRYWRRLLMKKLPQFRKRQWKETVR